MISPEKYLMLNQWKFVKKEMPVIYWYEQDPDALYDKVFRSHRVEPKRGPWIDF